MREISHKHHKEHKERESDMNKTANRLLGGIGGWIDVILSGIPFSVILVLMLTSEARGQWQFIVLCLVFLLISGFFVAKGIRFIVRRWREVGEMYDFIASLSPEEKAEFDKAIANGDVRIVRGDDGKIHTEALDFG